MLNRLIDKAVIFLLITLFIGCETPTETKQENNLFGKWQLKIVSGGFAGISDTLDISEDKYIVSFQDDNRFSRYHNDTLTLEGMYEVKKAKTIFSLDNLEIIDYYGYSVDINIENDVIAYLTKDTLVLADNFVDGFSKLYTRENN